MREIKFSGFENGKKVFGTNREITDEGGKQFRYSLNAFFDLVQKGLITNVCEFVGQKDKNKEEIYEDDILKHTDANGEKIGVATWMNEINSFRIVFNKGSYYFIQDIDEIIGNIHENPELLEGN